MQEFIFEIKRMESSVDLILIHIDVKKILFLFLEHYLPYKKEIVCLSCAVPLRNGCGN
jgi:hypothetical protein